METLGSILVCKDLPGYVHVNSGILHMQMFVYSTAAGVSGNVRHWHDNPTNNPTTEIGPFLIALI